MKDETNGYLGFALFFLIIVAIVVIGTYFLYQNPAKMENNPKENPTEENNNYLDDIKLDKNKDLIYFQNEDIISSSLEIVYKEVVINIDSEEALKVTQDINEETKSLKNKLKKITSNDTCSTDEDDIYEAVVRDFAIFQNDDYVTLTINDSKYDCNNSFGIITNMQAYVFDNKQGNLLQKEDILKKYGLKEIDLETKIRNHLVNKNDSQIAIEDTLKNMEYNNNYSLYVDEENNLILKYIVKTEGKDYNDTIVLN